MASDWRKNPVPYPSYLLTNNNANIRRTRQRIEDLKSQSEYAGWAFPGGRAEINEGENRLQLFFEEKPSEEQRRELKSNGFKWAPSQEHGRDSLRKMPSMRRAGWNFCARRMAEPLPAPALCPENGKGCDTMKEVYLWTKIKAIPF